MGRSTSGFGEEDSTFLPLTKKNLRRRISFALSQASLLHLSWHLDSSQFIRILSPVLSDCCHIPRDPSHIATQRQTSSFKTKFTMTWCADKADEEFWKTIPHQIYVWCELGNSQWANSKNLLAV